MRLVFRCACSGDVPAIVDLVESAYRGDSSRAGWTTEADLLDGQRTDPEAISAVITGPGSVMLLAEAERLAREEWSASTMVMSVLAQRPDLVAWYERRGYRRTGETTPFPYGNERFGVPKRPDLRFAILAKPLRGTGQRQGGQPDSRERGTTSPDS